MIAKNTLTGLGLFSLNIIHLISAGKKESIKEIEQHFSRCDVVDYLYQKYSSTFFIKFDNSLYDNSQINKYFYNYTGYIVGNEYRKYGIENEDDGLLLLLALITDKIEQSCIKWVAE